MDTFNLKSFVGCCTLTTPFVWLHSIGVVRRQHPTNQG